MSMVMESVAGRVRRSNGTDGLRALVASWYERLISRNQLAELDDRLLRDIGLTRADVDVELSKPFWR